MKSRGERPPWLFDVKFLDINIIMPAREIILTASDLNKRFNGEIL